jgi:DNA invertase Pin-like site-specific DNA recombinase
MVTKQIKELEVTKAKVEALEKEISKRLSKELASLHLTYGFATQAELIRALKSAGGSGSARRGRPSRGPKGAAAGGKRRKRSVITDETRASVKKLVEGKKTGAQIAKALGISLPSVQNIKKALGLVKARA